jgi:hypothetical protein
MTYSSLDGLRSSRNQYTDPPSLLELIFSSIVHQGLALRDGLRDAYQGQSSRDGQLRQGKFLMRILTIPTLLIFLWAWTIWRGERSVFQRSLAACQWRNWEQWVGIILVLPNTVY